MFLRLVDPMFVRWYSAARIAALEGFLNERVLLERVRRRRRRRRRRAHRRPAADTLPDPAGTHVA